MGRDVGKVAAEQGDVGMRRSNRMAPAAPYGGPRMVLLQRAFRCSNPWGKETGRQIYMHDMEW